MTKKSASKESDFREIRLFISSTFKDLEIERQLLVNNVFPKIRDFCRLRGVAFTEIDLRWGITDEEAKAYKVMKICLDEVDRCANFPPFFIGILGSRYGWIPEKIDWENATDSEKLIPGFEKRHKGKSITELEIQFGVLERPEMWPNAFFYFLDKGTEPEYQQNLLKNQIIEKGLNYRLDIKYPEELDEKIVFDLTTAIEKIYPINHKPSKIAQINLEQSLYSRSLTKTYVELPNLITDWKRYIFNSESNACSICLFGNSGDGKSAFLAFLSSQLQIEEGIKVFVHHIGVGDSRSRVTWMGCLFEWANKNGLTNLDIPSSPTEIQAQLPSLIMELENASKVIIVLDAIDQLDDGIEIDEWLPSLETKNISWIVSTTLDSQLDILKRRNWKILQLPLLNIDLAKKMIVDGLDNYRKRLPPDLLNKCLKNLMASQPLFLKVLLEEIRLHGKFETLDSHINSLLPSQTIENLFEIMIKRLEHAYGKKLVEVLILIGVSRFGVTEAELRECLQLRTFDVHRIILAITPYVTSSGGRISPFHEGFRRALLKQANINSLFETWLNYWKNSTDISRKFEEYPWILKFTNNLKNLEEWIWSQSTLGYAFRSYQIEILVKWQSLLKSQSISIRDLSIQNWNLESLQGLKDFAYQMGYRELEIMAQNAQNGKNGLIKSKWLIENSLIHYRGSNQLEAQKNAIEAVEISQSSEEILNSKMNLIQMYAFGDSPEEALVISKELFDNLKNTLKIDRQSEAYLHQYSSFACHFLDLNKQSNYHSLRAAELYASLSRRYDQGISWVNAADGAWGMGDYTQANSLFERALNLAKIYQLPNLEDISKICLANLRMSESRFEEAANLYSEGINLAIQIGHDWDALYGRIYQALTLGLMNMPHENLEDLSIQAKMNGYGYLSEISLAYQLVLVPDNKTNIEKLKNSVFPGPKAYAYAASIIIGIDEKVNLINLIQNTEGIKGPFNLIQKNLKLGKNI
jgi:hypothetical protein